MTDAEKYPLALPQGTVLAGRYIIEKVLGQGGFGITYKATDHVSNGFVAVKEFFPDTLAYRERTTVISYPGERSENFEYGKSNFLDEAKTLAQFIGNDNIVRIHNYFEENGTAYFVMEYVDGLSFDTYLKQNGGKISVQDAERVLIPVMDALAAVHSKGIVHRDVTPDNIYICNDGTIKLLDFGAARYSLGDKSRSLDVILKHGFAPKEQYTRRGKQGPFTDIYSLGASFYFAITGKRPPDSVDRLEEDELVPPSALGVDITSYQEEAILQAMEVQPQNRFQSMETFKRVLLNENAAAGDTGRTMQITNNFIDFSQQPVQQPYQAQEPAYQNTTPQTSWNLQPAPVQEVVQPSYQEQQPVQQSYQTQQPAYQNTGTQTSWNPQPAPAQPYNRSLEPVNNNDEKGSKKKLIIIISAIAAAVVIGVVILVLALSGNSSSNSNKDNSSGSKNSKDEDDEPTKAPTEKPTEAPTPTPTSTPTPSPSPSPSPSPTEAPTSTPTPTIAPTSAPLDVQYVEGNTTANTTLTGWVCVDSSIFYYALGDKIYDLSDGNSKVIDTAKSGCHFENLCYNYYNGALLYLEKDYSGYGRIKSRLSDGTIGYDTIAIDKTNVVRFYMTTNLIVLLDTDNMLYEINRNDNSQVGKLQLESDDFCIYEGNLYCITNNGGRKDIYRYDLRDLSKNQDSLYLTNGNFHDINITPDGYMLALGRLNETSTEYIYRIKLSSFYSEVECNSYSFDTNELPAGINLNSITFFDVTGYKRNLFCLLGYYDADNNWTTDVYHFTTSDDYSMAEGEYFSGGSYYYAPNLIIKSDDKVYYGLKYYNLLNGGPEEDQGLTFDVDGTLVK